MPRNPRRNRVAVIGGHNYKNILSLYTFLSIVHRGRPITEVLQSGEAEGSDLAARLWALERKIPIREAELGAWKPDSKPDCIIRVPGGGNDAVVATELARSQGVEVLEIKTEKLFLEVFMEDNPGWSQVPWFHSDECQSIVDNLDACSDFVYPQTPNRWQAFYATPFHRTRVIIVGSYPQYFLDSEGLAFSVSPKLKNLPITLQNIYKELYNDLGIRNRGGCLAPWAEQGVLLLNRVLSFSIQNSDWHMKLWGAGMVTSVLETLSQDRPKVFILWGDYARAFRPAIVNPERHLIIEGSYPFKEENEGFMGSRPFSRTNTFLQRLGYPPIDWRTKPPIPEKFNKELRKVFQKEKGLDRLTE